MTTMHPQTGRAVSDRLQSIQLSVARILLTPLGSRVERRDFGSLLPRLIDQPLLPELVLMIYSASAMALARQEPRLQISRLGFEVEDTPGAGTLTIEGRDAETGAALNLNVPLSMGRSA